MPGPQGEGRASVAAMVRVFQVASLSWTLLVYSSSQYAVHAFAYGAPGNSECGWQCPNADMLRLGVGLLQRRTAQVQLRWLSGAQRENGHLEAARALARKGLHDGGVDIWDVAPVLAFLGSLSSARVVPLALGDVAAVSKVECNLPLQNP